MCRSEGQEQREKERRRSAAGQSIILPRYRQIRLSEAHTSRFDDFDFAFHNPTRYAGLENEIANCYANALLQASFWIILCSFYG